MIISSTSDPYFHVNVTLPIRLVSEANVSGSNHWRHRQARAKAQRAAVAIGLRQILAPLLTWNYVATKRSPRRADNPGNVKGARMISGRCIPPDATLGIIITRIAPRALDSDNLVGSAKHVRDGIATLLGVNDNSPMISWYVSHKKGGAEEYATMFDITAWAWRTTP
jgi:hypothetical protein